MKCLHFSFHVTVDRKVQRKNWPINRNLQIRHHTHEQGKAGGVIHDGVDEGAVEVDVPGLQGHGGLALDITVEGFYTLYTLLYFSLL